MEFPANFDCSKQRAVRGPDGVAKIVDITGSVLMIPTLEPTEDSDPFAGRIARAKHLASKGAVIDTQVDIWGWGAENTMRLRRIYNKTEVPAAFGDFAILVPPAVS